MHSIFWKTLRDLRWQVFWYGVGFAALGAMVVFVYPSYHEQLAGFEIPEAFKPLIGDADYGTPEGFLSLEFFSWIPILAVIFAIMAGTSALAGEEAAGTLDLLLAQPISRVKLALAKMAALFVATLLIAGISYIGWLASVPFVEIQVSYARLLVGTAQIVPIVLLFGALAMWAAAFLPDRGQATGLVTAFAVVSFFVNYLAGLVDSLAAMRWVSVFYYHDASHAVTRNPDPLKVAVLLVATLIFAALALVAFEHREIGVRGIGLSLPRFAARRSAALTPGER